MQFVVPCHKCIQFNLTLDNSIDGICTEPQNTKIMKNIEKVTPKMKVFISFCLLLRANFDHVIFYSDFFVIDFLKKLF
jgi:hypothetical protein